MTRSHPREERGQAGEGACLTTPEMHLREFASNTKIPGARVRLDLTEMPHIGSSSYSAEVTALIGEAVSAHIAPASQAAPVTGTEGQIAWLPMKDAPTGVPIIAKHKPNARMPHGWVATIKLGHRDEEEPDSLDTILHYNADSLFWNFHGCWDGWLPIGSQLPAPQPAGAERVDLGWTCAARRQGTAGGNDPADCDWPMCGCDPYADEVIATLQESGHLVPASLPAALGSGEGTAASDVLAERRRQVEAEGYTTAHDDEHAKGEIARAAACYARIASDWDNYAFPIGCPADWPWSPVFWKWSDPRRDLVKAGALILAEIERLDRAAPCDEPPKGEDAPSAAEGRSPASAVGEAEAPHLQSPSLSEVEEAKAVLNKYNAPESFAKFYRSMARLENDPAVKAGWHKSADAIEAALATLTASQEQDGEVRHG